MIIVITLIISLQMPKYYLLKGLLEPMGLLCGDSMELCIPYEILFHP